jgi:uncharacterized protein YqeY
VRLVPAARISRAVQRGLGVGEAKRRSLSEGEVEKIVRAEVTGRRAAAREYERAGHTDQADRLRREACVLGRPWMQARAAGAGREAHNSLTGCNAPSA